MAWMASMFEDKGGQGARALYERQCAVCHGKTMQGSPPAIPSLFGISNKRSPQELTATIRGGKGRMPGFSSFSDDQLNSLVRFLLTGEDKELPSNGAPSDHPKYLFTGYRRFVDPDGYPAIAPPWGTLNAIDMNTGEYKWKINLGEYPELAAQGLRNTGSENYGGPIVTAGGLLFIGATNYDKKFRAFDKFTGELLWETTLPFAGNATPITYSANGRQFVVIAAGGGKDPKSGSGGLYVAFALPETKH
jgi:quinoprotein glucose dehydrogenase